jgi:hypothetical protein
VWSSQPINEVNAKTFWASGGLAHHGEKCSLFPAKFYWNCTSEISEINIELEEA